MAERRGQRRRGILSSGVWKRLLEERDYRRFQERFAAVVREISEQDVEDLAALCAKDDADDLERQRALATLGLLARAGDPRLTSKHRAEWTRGCVQAARAEYPKTLLGRTAFEQLWREDAVAAESLVTAVDPKTLDEAAREELVRAVGRYLSPAAVARLRELEQLGGRPAGVARSVLEARGLASLEPIQELARQWRSSRSPDLLHSLYLRYVTHQVGKALIEDLVRLLGRPDRRDGNFVWYMPNSATALFLEGDSEGVLQATKFT